VRERTDAKKGPVMKWIEGPVACDSGSIARRLRPPQSEVQLQFCDDPPIAHALRCQNAADGCGIPLTNVSVVTRSKHRNAA
jgi:hypothetical protein